MDIGLVGGIAAGIAMLGVFMAIFSFLPTYRAQHGNRYERDLEKKTGLSTIADRARTIYRATRQEKRRGQREAKKHKRKQKHQAKDRYSRKEAKAERQADIAKIADERASVDLSALGSRAEGLVAGLTAIEQSIEKYCSKETADEQKEEHETQLVVDCVQKIAQVENYMAIDDAVHAQLASLVNNLLGFLEQEDAIEQEKNLQAKQVIADVQEAIKEMRSIISDAKNGEKNFERHEKKSYKTHKLTIKRIYAAIQVRRGKLARELAKAKKADPAVIQQLMLEIRAFKQYHAAAKRISQSLSDTKSLVAKQVRQTKMIVLKLRVKQQFLYRVNFSLRLLERKLERKDGVLEKEFSKFRNKVRQIVRKDRDSVLAVSLSDGLNKFIDNLVSVEQLRIRFNKILRNVFLTGFVMARLTETYEKLLDALNESEKSMTAASELLDRIIEQFHAQDVTGVSGSEKRSALADLKEVLEQEHQLNTEIERLVKSMEQRYNLATGLLDQLDAEDGRLTATLQHTSGVIGSLLGNAMAKKNAIKQDFQGNLQRYETHLEQNNVIASKAYKKAVTSKM